MTATERNAATAGGVSPTPGPPGKPGATRTLRALGNRNYRLFFGGQGVSLIGTWMQSVALSWLVYRLTGSALLLGTVAFATQIPMLVLAPVAGVLADRWPLRRVLMLTQTLAAVQALVLGALTLSGLIQVWEILALGVVLGSINALDMPIRQTFVIQMVDRPEDLGNAIALNSLLVNGARLVGPSIAGLVIAALGEGVCFLLNALSYSAVILALWAMRLPPHRRATGAASFVRGLREGLAYALGFPPIRAVLLLLAASSLLGMSYATLMPIFAAEVLGGGPQTLGFLLGATGTGAVLGALYLATRSTVLGLGRVIALGQGLFGLGLVAVSFSRALWISLPLMVLVGLGMMLQIASSNTVLQTVVEDDKRGRVMSLYSVAFLGMVPFGSLLVGSLAHSLGAPRALALGGSGCVLAAIVFARQLPTLRRWVRPVYVRKGIMSAPAHLQPRRPAQDGEAGV